MTGSNQIKKISIVSPFFNEQESAELFYRACCQATLTLPEILFEFIFVDDGSTDHTAQILKRLALSDSRIRFFALARNFGHQFALTAGIHQATGDLIVNMDSDLQDSPLLISEMKKKIDEGFDVVHMQRISRPGETPFKLWSAKLFYAWITRLSKTPMYPNIGDFRAFTKEVQAVFIRFNERHLYLRGIFFSIGFKQCILPYRRNERAAGITKYPLKKMIALAIDGTLSFSTVPLTAMLWTSLMLWASSLLYLVYALLQKYLYHQTVQGWVSLIVIILFCTGLILSALAIIGAYLGRAFEQLQNRPLYWFKPEIFNHSTNTHQQPIQKDLSP